MFLLQKIISRDLAMMDTIMKETAEIEARQKELDAQMADIEKMRSDWRKPRSFNWKES